MKTADKSFSAADGLKITAWAYVPDEAVAAVQLIHGSVEHAARYGAFIEALAAEGVAVYIMDLRGHGSTGEASGQMCIFSMQPRGWELAIGDLRRQRQQIQDDLPGLPLFLMGHSMGSFLARDLAGRDGSDYAGLILSGTGRAPAALTYSGLLLAKLLMRFSRNAPSALLQKMVYGKLNDAFKNPRTDFDFLSRDESVVDAYIKDPWCGNVITPEYGHEMVQGILNINRQSCYRQTPDHLPIYLFSGEMDPVGGSKASFVLEVAELYRKNGCRDVETRIYPEGRHEMLNEINRSDVYTHVISWLRSRSN